MINADAKLLAKTLALRLTTVLEDLLHFDQIHAGEGHRYQHP